MSASPLPPLPGRPPGRGSGTRLWLLRHAEVREEWRGVAYGRLDVPLSAAGRRATDALAARFAELSPAAVFSSPLRRASELAHALARRAGLEARLEDGLSEIDRGAWQGVPVEELYAQRPDEVEAFHADPWSWRAHGGECDALVYARAWPVFERASHAHPGGVVVLCSHYNVIRVLAARALGLPPARSFALRVDPGRGVFLVDAAGGWVLHHSNVAGPPRSTDDVTDPTHPSHPAGGRAGQGAGREPA